jgi:predicted HicB family RNase H-like nuclease
MPEAVVEEFCQLATRLPKSLHKKLKLHAVTTDQSIADLVARGIAMILKEAR